MIGFFKLGMTLNQLAKGSVRIVLANEVLYSYFKLAPAQKHLPVPMSMRTLIFGSLSSFSNYPFNLSINKLERLFRLFG